MDREIFEYQIGEIKQRMSDQKKMVPVGCIYFIWLGIVCSGLLVLNIAIVGLAIEWVAGTQPWFSQQVKLQQILRYVVPIAMIFIQFWLYDYFRDKIDRRQDIEDPRSVTSD